MHTYDLQEMTENHVNARRNYFMGLWAGRQLGLASNALPEYVSSLMKADQQESGPLPVVRKIREDLVAKGKPCCEKELLNQLIAFERQARLQMSVTD